MEAGKEDGLRVERETRGRPGCWLKQALKEYYRAETRESDGSREGLGKSWSFSLQTF